MAFDVFDRLDGLRDKFPGLILYCLVDGAQYLQRIGKQFTPSNGAVALFQGTPDAALAFAGPWLIEVGAVEATRVDELVEFERTSHGISWLITYQNLEGLSQLLRLFLDVELPDGRRALVRFWDTRVLANLAQVLDPIQRRELFGHVFEWHLLLDRERRVRLGRSDD